MSEKSLLGCQVVDKVTGLKGTAVSIIEYMNGCIQYGIQPKIIVAGVPADAKYYDADQVELIKLKKKKVKAKRPGGPTPNTVPAIGRRRV